MPAETVVVVAAIVAAFAFFALPLASADFYSRKVRTPGASYFRNPK